MSLEIILSAQLHPVSLDEAKAFLRVDSTYEDALISEFIGAATARVEALSGRALINRTLRQHMAGLPKTGIIDLLARPLVSVEQVRVLALDGTSQILDPSSYYVDMPSARVIVRNDGLVSFAGPQSAGLEIDFIAGYGVDALAVPDALKTAIKQLVVAIFEQRDQNVVPVPLAVQSLLAPYSRVRL